MVATPPRPPVINMPVVALTEDRLNAELAVRLFCLVPNPAAIMTKQEFTVINKAMTLVIAYLRGIQNPKEVCENLGITEWMRRDQEVTGAKDLKKPLPPDAPAPGGSP